MNYTDNTNMTTSSTVSEIPLMRLTSTPEERLDMHHDSEFIEEPSGLIVLSRADFESLRNAQRSLSAQLKEAQECITTLRNELASAKELAPIDSVHNVSAQYKMFMELTKERQDVTGQLLESKEEATQLKQQAAKLQSDVESYERDYDSLSADYAHLEKVYTKTRDLFTRKISEVFRAQVELREPRLRPKAPEGCLICGVSGHSFRTCQKPYGGRFCQKCANPDFSTDYCPWPHYSGGSGQIPESSRCKICWRPHNLPDVNCADCRKRMIRSRIIKRNQQAQMLEDQATQPPPPKEKKPIASTSSSCDLPVEALPVESVALEILSTLNLNNKSTGLEGDLAETHKLEVHEVEKKED